MSSFDVATVRDKFPALKQKQFFFDNAGGSQILGDVVDSIVSYLTTTNVQLGASYSVGQQSTAKYTRGVEAAAKYINADPDEVVIGASTTQLLRNLSEALDFSPGDEIIVSALDHEANIAPWVALAAARNLTLKWWTVPAGTTNPILTPSSLVPLLSSRTRLVTCTHASNILGTIHPIRALADTVHTVPGAYFQVDGVAYAPHARLDMRELGVDFYTFSWYKVYGPHVSLLYGRRAAHEASVRSLGHFFNPSQTLEQKLSLAASNYELTASIPVVVDYMERVGEAIPAHEERLQSILLDYLRSKPDVFTIFGVPDADRAKRVPTVSWGVKGKSAKEVVEAVEKTSDFAFRWGHFYSKRLVDDVLQAGEHGVVRFSMVHYNTEEEVKSFVETFDRVIFG
ncbi:pyridoxal phosphate-dependent transferase [Phyllosticta citrichinensis]|uniref:Pyridoxal phosphate-dependent transferase n=1 Tax=Phyllosticta citrichinensis TaxID=1130410 RepID=A0ABR1XKU2_9PEZI